MTCFSQSIINKFIRSLRYGTGKAFFILQKYPALPVDDFLIDAALHNYDYDPQCAGSRASQLTELLKLRSNYSELISRIAEYFAKITFTNNTKFDTAVWDLAQIYELLAHNRISPRITEIIHHCFVRDHTSDDWLGAGDIMETEGIAGLLFVAKTVGTSLRNNPHFEMSDSLPFYIKETFKPDHDWRAILKNASETDADVRAFFSAIKRHEQEEKNRKMPPQGQNDMKQIMAFLQKKKKCYIYRVQLTKPQQAKLRAIFMHETNTNNLYSICSVLAKTGGITRAMIPKLSDLIHSSNKSLSCKAIAALGTVKSKKVRQIALREINENPNRWKYVELLKKNWNTGDEKFIIGTFNRLRSNTSRHSILMNTISIDNVPVSLLKYLFGRTDCGCCRVKIAEKLSVRGNIDEEMALEFIHDSMKEVREIGKNIS